MKILKSVSANVDITNIITIILLLFCFIQILPSIFVFPFGLDDDYFLLEAFIIRDNFFYGSLDVTERTLTHHGGLRTFHIYFYLLLYFFFGLNAQFYHLVKVFLYLGTAIFIYLSIRELKGKKSANFSLFFFVIIPYILENYFRTSVPDSQIAVVLVLIIYLSLYLDKRAQDLKIAIIFPMFLLFPTLTIVSVGTKEVGFIVPFFLLCYSLIGMMERRKACRPLIDKVIFLFLLSGFIGMLIVFIIAIFTLVLSPPGLSGAANYIFSLEIIISNLLSYMYQYFSIIGIILLFFLGYVLINLQNIIKKFFTERHLCQSIINHKLFFIGVCIALPSFLFHLPYYVASPRYMLLTNIGITMIIGELTEHFFNDINFKVQNSSFNRFFIYYSLILIASFLGGLLTNLIFLRALFVVIFIFYIMICGGIVNIRNRSIFLSRIIKVIFIAIIFSTSLCATIHSYSFHTQWITYHNAFGESMEQIAEDLPENSTVLMVIPGENLRTVWSQHVEFFLCELYQRPDITVTYDYSAKSTSMYLLLVQRGQIDTYETMYEEYQKKIMEEQFSNATFFSRVEKKMVTLRVNLVDIFYLLVFFKQRPDRTPVFAFYTIKSSFSLYQL